MPHRGFDVEDLPDDASKCTACIAAATTTTTVVYAETANGSSATAAAVGTFTLIASVLLNLMIHHWDAVSAVVG